MHILVEQAIRESITRNQTVTIDLNNVPYDSDIRASLIVECDDWNDAALEERDFWGVTDDGHAWRVRLAEGTAI